MNRSLLSCCLLALLIAPASYSKAADTGADTEVTPGIPVKDTVTLVDLGADTCIPCKMMIPILDELKSDYQGRAAVLFIDVHKQPEMSHPFRVLAIPTQLIYDRHGKEVYRHVGFVEKKALQHELDHLLGAQ